MTRRDIRKRVAKLEAQSIKLIVERACICFPDGEPPMLLLAAEREAVSAVLCPLHGRRFRAFDNSIFIAHLKPLNLQADLRGRSKRYRKAMEASFPADRWPATEVIGPGPVVRYLLKDGAEIYRAHLQAICDSDCRPIFKDGKQAFTLPNGKVGFLEPRSAVPSQDLFTEEERRWRSAEKVLAVTTSKGELGNEEDNHREGTASQPRQQSEVNRTKERNG